LADKKPLGGEAMAESTRDFLAAIGKVLLRCWIFGFALMFVSFVIFMLMRSTIDDLHGRMFGVSPHELDLIFYCGMGLFKLCVLVCFFIPWLSIKLVLTRINRQ
jgi:hypothetical protein